MPRRLLGPVALIAAVALTGCGSQSGASGPGRMPPPRPSASASPSAASIQARAVSDAAAHLAAFRPPADARKLPVRPRNATLLNQPGMGMPTKYDVVDTAWWQVTGSPRAVIEALARPAGSTRDGGGSASDGAATAYDVAFDWPPVAGILSSRTLGVSAEASGSGTVLRVDAITSWTPPRDAGSLVPASARSVTITFAPGSLTGKAKTYGPTVVTDAARVGAIIAAVNAAPIDTRGALPCPMSLGGHMDLAFHGSAAGSTVATVIVNTDGCGRAAVEIIGGESVLVTGGPDLANTIMSVAGVTWPRMK